MSSANRNNLTLNTNSDFGVGAEILQKISISSLFNNNQGQAESNSMESPIEEKYKFGDIDFSDHDLKPLAQQNSFSNLNLVPGKPFERFNFENPRVLQRTSSYDYSPTSPMTPSSPSSLNPTSTTRMSHGSPTSSEDPVSNFGSTGFFFGASDPLTTTPNVEEENELQSLMYHNFQAMQMQQLKQFQWQLLQFNLAKTMQANVENGGFERRFHRSSNAIDEASYTWSGILPTRTHRFITYSTKVFLGGIPWDITENTLMQIFKPFGEIRVEWPGKEQNCAQPKGYVYIIFESEKQVKQLLQSCNLQASMNGAMGNYSSSESSFSSECSNHITRMPANNSAVVLPNQYENYYYKISSKRIKAKVVEVIPWIIGDSNYMKTSSPKYDPTKTVFVGGLHGQLSAEGLAKIMNDLFDGVSYVGIDTDKFKYPIGSGRVTFNNQHSYMRAVAASYIEVQTPKFTKKIQINPYLEDSLCSFCGIQHGPYYCRDLACFRYYCSNCWKLRHDSDPHLCHHKPMTRNSRSHQSAGAGQQQFHNYHSNSTTHSNSLDNSPQTTPSSVDAFSQPQTSMFDFALK